MKNPNSKFLALGALFFLVTTNANASTKRIRSVHFDKGEVQRILMAPGLATAMTFPCDINEAIIGRQEDLKAQVSPTTKKQLTLFLSSRAALPTNLLVRCGDKRDLFVFDIIPSTTSHQDVFKVRAFSGGPEIEDLNLTQVDSSDKPRTQTKSSAKRKSKVIFESKAPELFEESK